MVRQYPGERRYILETEHGCYSDYGWTIANTSETLKEGLKQYNHWKKTSGRYRLIDNETSEVLAGDS